LFDACAPVCSLNQYEPPLSNSLPIRMGTVTIGDHRTIGDRPRFPEGSGYIG
jgi:hypothetical protein